jgi:hypothetical protein
MRWITWNGYEIVKQERLSDIVGTKVNKADSLHHVMSAAVTATAAAAD